MKTTFFFSLFVGLFLLESAEATAQAQAANQTFWVHEDQVKPSMTKEYEAVTKDFIAALKKHNIKETDFSTARLDNGTYLSISPVSNMADLDKNPLAPLAEKMGNEKFGELFTRFNKCYDVHKDYMVHLIEDLSYMPDGLTTNTPGQDFRKWHFLHVTPENVSALREKMLEIKELYKEKAAKENYRVYRNGFGSDGDYYLVVISAKDAQSYAQTSDETEELLGQEGKELFEDMMQYVKKYETETGFMRPDLAYTSN